jgi:hypothetical protein
VLYRILGFCGDPPSRTMCEGRVPLEFCCCAVPNSRILWRTTTSDDMLCSNARSDLSEVAAISIHLGVCACELIPTSGGDRSIPLEVGCCALPNSRILWRPTISDVMLCSNARSDPYEVTALPIHLCVCLRADTNVWRRSENSS